MSLYCLGKALQSLCNDTCLYAAHTVHAEAKMSVENFRILLDAAIAERLLRGPPFTCMCFGSAKMLSL
jgi:hypothetical protein